VRDRRLGGGPVLLSGRARWFKRGFDTGEVRCCDTFAASTL
jgi:predicted metalloprotease